MGHYFRLIFRFYHRLVYLERRLSEYLHSMIGKAAESIVLTEPEKDVRADW
jgi:hypothetical protein